VSSGRRVSNETVSHPELKVCYIYDGGQVICEYDSEYVLRRKFVYGTGIDEVVRMSHTRRKADIDDDGDVDIYDLHAMAAVWLDISGNPGAADLNYDGKVNNIDSDILAANWLTDGLDCEENYYYHYDDLGSVVAISDNGGQMTERYYYDLFSNQMIYSPCYAPQAT